MDNTDLLLLAGFCLYWSETYSTFIVLTNAHVNKHAYKQEEISLQEKAFSSVLRNGYDHEVSDMDIFSFNMDCNCPAVPGLISRR